MIINYKKIKDTAEAPTRGSAYAAGLDLYACPESDTVDVPSGSTVKIGTGICIEIPNGCFGAVFARSGLATKRGLRPANCVGVIDSDYRGELIVALHNDSDKTETIENGDRIAQIVVMPYFAIELNEVSELTETARGDGGFGSTGMSHECEYEQLSLFDVMEK